MTGNEPRARGVKYHPIPQGTWNKRLLALGLETAFTYLYVLSGPHRASEGLYRLPLQYAAADLEFSIETIREALSKLEGEGLVKYDHEAEVILDTKALLCLPPKSPTQIVGAMSKLLTLPRTDLLVDLFEIAVICSPQLAKAMEERWPWLDLAFTQRRDTSDTPSIPSPDSSDTQPDSASSSSVARGRVQSSGSNGSPSPEKPLSPEEVADRLGASIEDGPQRDKAHCTRHETRVKDCTDCQWSGTRLSAVGT